MIIHSFPYKRKMRKLERFVILVYLSFIDKQNESKPKKWSSNVNKQNVSLERHVHKYFTIFYACIFKLNIMYRFRFKS